MNQKIADRIDYIYSVDANIRYKYDEVKGYLKPGRVVDLGSNIGSWIKHASEDPNMKNSLFAGVDISNEAYLISLERLESDLPHNTRFIRADAEKGIFPSDYVDTFHSSSITHEIYSQKGSSGLFDFMSMRYRELKKGGVWVNRDMIKPDPDPYVIMVFADNSEYDRFLKFSKEFTIYHIEFMEIPNEQKQLKLKLSHAMEFLLKKDYQKNWNREMKEAFCFWTFSDWKHYLESHHFIIDPRSHTYSNPYILNRRFKNIQLYNSGMEKISFPHTHVLTVAIKS